MIDSTSIITYSYNDFCKGIDRIFNEIKESGFKPDYIVGIVRGGAIPAVYLSHRLKIPVQMVHWSTRDKTDDFGNESNLWIPEDIRDGKKILLVDDIVDGGETIKELLADWQSAVHAELSFDNVKVAALVYNKAQDLAKVDFCDIEINRNEEPRWLVFPWEC